MSLAVSAAVFYLSSCISSISSLGNSTTISVLFMTWLPPPPTKCKLEAGQLVLEVVVSSDLIFEATLGLSCYRDLVVVAFHTSHRSEALTAHSP